MSTVTIAKLGGAIVVAAALGFFAFASAAGGSLFGSTASAGYGQTKVTLCHKGNTITVGAPATSAHLGHGDTLGPCPS